MPRARRTPANRWCEPGVEESLWPNAPCSSVLSNVSADGHVRSCRALLIDRCGLANSENTRFWGNVNRFFLAQFYTCVH